ncbi:MAG: MFS transporter [Clostridiales bacterium]|nr:MFS transporter [Clostridiales bacterium]
MKRILNLEYGGIWCMYWTYFAVLLSFGSVFLLAKGFSNYEIGILFAIASILGAVIQPPLADIADNSKRLRIHRLMELLMLLMILLGAGLFVFKTKSAPLFVIYLLLYAFHLALQGQINALLFTLEETGHKIYFGVCRASGSIAYSAVMAVLGVLVEKYTSDILPYAGMVFLLGWMAFLAGSDLHYLRAMRAKKDAASAVAESPAADGEAPAEAASEEPIHLIAFLKRNKLFLVLSIGVLFFFFGNAVQNTFIYQIVTDVGGTSADLGVVAACTAMSEVPALILFDVIRKHIHVNTLLKIAAVAFVAKFVMLWLAKAVWVICLAQVFQAIYIVVMPAMIYFIDQIMDKGEAVKGQAWFMMATTVASVIASYIGGLILDAAGAKMLCFAAAVAALIGAVIYFLTVDRFDQKDV